MKRSAVMATLVAMILAGFLWPVDAWGRAGGGGSFGSRGSRSYSAPARPSPSPSRPVAPPPSGQPAPQRPAWMGGLLGGIGGFFLGGLIGRLLFGGLGGGFGGGIGLMEILIIAGLAYAALSYARRRHERMPAGPHGYATSQGADPTPWRPESPPPAMAARRSPCHRSRVPVPGHHHSPGAGGAERPGSRGRAYSPHGRGVRSCALRRHRV